MDKSKYIEIERKQHPWASDDILECIVDDELRNDPAFYEDAMEEPEEADEDEDEDKPGIKIEIKMKAKTKQKKEEPEQDEVGEDPFPKNEFGEE